MNRLKIDRWTTPVTGYPRRTHGGARIGRTTYEPGVYSYYGLDGYPVFELTRSIEVTELQRRSENGEWKTWMVDDPPHMRQMELYAGRARGHVLVTGLGLGLVTHALLRNSSVERVAVVDIDPDVIGLIKPLLPNDRRLEVVRGEFEATTLRGELAKERWDHIIVDLWVTNGRDQWREACEEAVAMARRIVNVHPSATLAFHGFGGIPEIMAQGYLWQKNAERSWSEIGARAAKLDEKALAELERQSRMEAQKPRAPITGSPLAPFA